MGRQVGSFIQYFSDLEIGDPHFLQQFFVFFQLAAQNNFFIEQELFIFFGERNQRSISVLYPMDNPRKSARVLHNFHTELHRR